MLQTQRLARFAPLLTALACASLLGSCIVVVGDDWGWDSRNTLRGSGVELRDQRSVESFHSVKVRDAIDVNLRCGEATSVEVVCDDNLLPHLLTEVEDGVLTVRYADEPFDAYRAETDVRVEITTPELKSFSIAGSSDTTLSGLDTSELRLAISGSGNLEAHGRADRLETTISGSGNMHLEELPVRSARVAVSGSGDVELNVSDELTVSISGSGDVTYRGEPRTTVQISGSGSVQRD